MSFGRTTWIEIFVDTLLPCRGRSLSRSREKWLASQRRSCRYGAPTRSQRCVARMVAKCYHYAMSQPVKISDELILDARLTAEIAERSIAGQIEFWRSSAERSNHCSKAPEHSPFGEPARQSRCRSVWPRLIRLRGAGASWNTSSRGRFPTISRFPARRACWSGSMAMAREPWADSSVGNSRRSHAPDRVRGV